MSHLLTEQGPYWSSLKCDAGLDTLHRHIDAYRCTCAGRSGRPPSLMASTTLTDVQFSETTCLDNSSDSSSDLCAGSAFMHMQLRDSYTMLMMTSVYLSVMICH